jgi:hypothetical protein
MQSAGNGDWTQSANFPRIPGERACEEIGLETLQSANFLAFPAESRDPSLNHTELLKEIAVPCQPGWARAAER